MTKEGDFFRSFAEAILEGMASVWQTRVGARIGALYVMFPEVYRIFYIAYQNHLFRPQFQYSAVSHRCREITKCYKININYYLFAIILLIFIWLSLSQFLFCWSAENYEFLNSYSCSDLTRFTCVN